MKRTRFQLGKTSSSKVLELLCSVALKLMYWAQLNGGKDGSFLSGFAPLGRGLHPAAERDFGFPAHTWFFGSDTSCNLYLWMRSFWSFCYLMSLATIVQYYSGG